MSAVPTLQDLDKPTSRTWTPTRVRWWYEAIADWMLANPQGNMKQCAEALGRHHTTIAIIARSDAFRAYYEQRRAAYTRRHDETILQKMQAIAIEGLDNILDRLETKKDAIPLREVTNITESVLSRLGYAPESKGTSVNVNVNQGDNGKVAVAITSEDLQAARQKYKELEHSRAAQPPGVYPVPEQKAPQLAHDPLEIAAGEVLELEANPVNPVNPPTEESES